VKDNRDDREDQEDMNEEPGRMEDDEAAQPGHNQDNANDQKHAFFSLAVLAHRMWTGSKVLAGGLK
jgi:hypothetical protein